MDRSNPSKETPTKRVRPMTASDANLKVRLLHLANRMLAQAYHRMHVLSPPRLPKTGPAILVCNHVSSLDPLALQAVHNRVITWMMAREYYDIKALNWAFRAINAIPVDRGMRDTAAIRAAMRAINDGHVLGIFPEGKFSLKQELLPFQTGVAMMAIRLNAPVYPAYLELQRGLDVGPAVLIPNDVYVQFGGEVILDRSSTTPEALERATATIQEAVEALRIRPIRPRRRRIAL